MNNFYGTKLAIASLASSVLFLGACSDSSSPSSEYTPLVSFSEICYNGGDSLIAEFVEIYNGSDEEQDLSGVILKGQVDFTFPEATTPLAAGERYVVYRDAARFAKTHPETASFGPYTGSLDNSGGSIELETTKGTSITEAEYSSGNSWTEAADGLGYCLISTSDTSSRHPEDWTTGKQYGGSPTLENTAFTNKIQITEVLPLGTDGSSWIEIQNISDDAVALGNFILSDNKSGDFGLVLPDSSLAAGAFTTIGNEFSTASIQFSGFSLSVDEDKVVLVEKVDGKYTGQISSLSFEGASIDQSFGPSHSSSTKGALLSSTTLGAANSELSTGSFRVNEIHYNPIDGNSEFIEFKNTSEEAVSLSMFDTKVQAYKFSGIDINLDSIYTVSAGELIVAIPNDVLINSAIKIVSYSGKLSNAGEDISIEAPVRLSTNDSNEVITIHKIVDYVDYRDSWYPSTDGEGESLNRSNSSFSTKESDWTNAAPTPGS
jgi:hypothetical protein